VQGAAEQIVKACQLRLRCGGRGAFTVQGVHRELAGPWRLRQPEQCREALQIVACPAADHVDDQAVALTVG
jgi:hypothetical protein